jgi:hypothetical protein
MLTGLLIFPAGLQLSYHYRLVRSTKSSAARGRSQSSPSPTQQRGHCDAKIHKAVFLSSLTAFISGLDPFGFNGILPFKASRSLFVVSLTLLGLCFVTLTQRPVATLLHFSPSRSNSLPRMLFWGWKIAECTLYVAVAWTLLFHQNAVGLDPDEAPVQELAFLSTFFVAVSMCFLLIPSIWALGVVLFEIRSVEKALESTTTIDYGAVKRRLVGALVFLFSFLAATLYMFIPQEQTVEDPCESGCAIARDSYPWEKFAPVICRLIFLCTFLYRAWMPFERFQARINTNENEMNQSKMDPSTRSRTRSAF